MIPEPLRDVARQVHEEGLEPEATVRTLLGWFGARRRGFAVIAAVRAALKEARLQTRPDFESAYVDSVLHFIPAGRRARKAPADAEGSEGGDTTPGDEPDEAAEPTSAELVQAAMDDPTFRIGQLSSANVAPVSVTPGTALKEATTLMMMHDFSQLPVMHGDRNVKGVVSWETIGRRQALGQGCEMVRDCMETAVPEVAAESSLFAAINLIVRHGFVLVRQRDRRISGMVTTSDLSFQFRQLAEPFLLVGEIENYIRRLVGGKFTPDELISVRDPDDPRPVDAVTDLSFGEYVRLLEDPENWEHLDVPSSPGNLCRKLGSGP